MTAADTSGYFNAQVLPWWQIHGRRYPWRESDNPFHLLLAELMLRRTRAEQVVPVYQRFTARFPSIPSLADAAEAEVAALLRPLGLNWRVPAFRQLAQVLRDLYGAAVPVERAALLSLPGVGDYVASAVRSFAFGLPDPVIDTNTVRVAGRYFGFPVDPESRRRAPVRAAIATLVDPACASASNLALLDFAALVCRAGRPRCESCPVASRCAFMASMAATNTGGVSV